MAIARFAFPNKNEKEKTSAAPQGAEALQGGSAAPQGAEALQGEPAAPQGAEALQGGSAAPQGAEALQGEPAAPQGAEALQGGSAAPQGAEALQGEPAAPQGAEALQGEPAAPQGTEAPQGLTIIEKAKWYRTLVDTILGGDVGPIREGLRDTRISYRTAKRYIAILDLIEPMQKLVESGHIGINAGSEIAGIDHEKQLILYRYLERQGEKGNLSAKQAREIAQCKRQDFKKYVEETLKTEIAEQSDFYDKVLGILKVYEVEISEQKLLNIIESAIISYKNNGELL